MKKYLVYVHTNKINGKKYVGITSTTLSKRWRNGIGYCPRGNGKSRFWNAIQKYGWDNFEHGIIAINLSKDKANEIEQFLIKEWNLTDGEYGYNIMEGGNFNTITGKKIIAVELDEIFNTIAEAKKKYHGDIKGVLYGNQNVTYTIYKGKHIRIHWWYLEDWEALSIDKKEEIKNNYAQELLDNRVVLVNTGEIFEDFKDASEKTGVPNDYISCKCRHKDCGGKGLKNGEITLWEFYSEYMTKTEEQWKLEVKRVNDEYKEILRQRSELKSKKGKERWKNKSQESKDKLQKATVEATRKCVICLNTGEIYESTKEVKRQTGINNVGTCCNGKQKTAGKMIIDGEKVKLRWRFITKEAYSNLIAIDKKDRIEWLEVNGGYIM